MSTVHDCRPFVVTDSWTMGLVATWRRLEGKEAEAFVARLRYHAEYMSGDERSVARRSLEAIDHLRATALMQDPRFIQLTANQ